MQNTILELKAILRKFQEGYDKRDINLIDNFMEALFDKDESLFLLGASDNELSFGIDEVKELLISDWKYWGDVKLDIDNSVIKHKEDTSWIYTPATIKYTFADSEETYSNFLGFIGDFYNSQGQDSEKLNRVKLTEINWILCHLLHQREGTERSYLWDGRISFVLTKKNEEWKIRQIQFSIPTNSPFPDERINSDTPYQIHYDKELERLRLISNINQLKEVDVIKELLNKLSMKYLDRKTSSSFIAELLSTNKPMVVNTNSNIYQGEDSIIKLIDNHRNTWQEISFNFEEAIVDSHKDVVWLITTGLIKKIIPEEILYNNQGEEINQLLTSDLPNKEKLFRIRRNISKTLMEASMGEEYLWPFRFEAVIVKEKGQWLFNYIQFSFPSNVILEGKTDEY